MTIRHILFAALAASVALTSGAAAGPAATSVPPPVGRIAKELAGGGAKRVIVFASVGDKSYVATAGTRRPKADQRFRVGSVTKTFTATIVLQLVDEGKLGVNSTLGDHVPGVVPRGKEITIRQLLQHQSGLVDYTDPEYESWGKDASKSPSTRPIDLLRFAGSKPLAFEPGSQWSYSNTNYIALGLVIERVTGRSYADALERRIFQPLELDATELPQTRRLPDLDDGGFNPNTAWAAGAIVSNVRDLSRFYSALLSGRILSANSLAAMKKTVAVGPGGAYGLGLGSIGVRCGRAWGHGGGILDYTTLAIASDSGERVGVVSIHGRPADQQPDESALVCPDYRLAASAATQHIAFVRRGGIYAMNADGSRQRRLVAGSDPAWSPDGRKMAFVSRGAIYAMSADGSGQRRLARGSAPVWSPNGQRIAFLRGGAIYAMKTDGSGLRRLVSGGDPAWSLDGQRIAFVRGSGNRAEIYLVNAGGDGQRRLARGSDPAWSPDGRRIAFARKIAFPSGVGGNLAIFVMNADGSGQRRLTHLPARGNAPAWSPDGRKITFQTQAASGGGGHSWHWYGVSVVNADGSGQPRHLSGGEPLEDRVPPAARPRWSPDGRMIAFLSWRAGNYDVYVMNADGSALTNVTRSRAKESSFAWSPRQTKGS